MHKKSLAMNIALISPYPDIMAFGLRTISAYLKQNGHTVRLIFLPDPFSDNLLYGVKRYEDYVLEELLELCSGSDLIGLTLMTNFFDGAVQATQKIKSRLNAPIIWGGVHPTIRPEESLEYADIVCVGDGEEAMLMLADKMSAGSDPTDTPNLWFKREGRIIKNRVGPLADCLDVYPQPDYSFEDHYILIDGHIVPLTVELAKKCFAQGAIPQYLKMIGYQTMTGRGCPHKCTYCINDAIKNLYRGAGYLRWRSIEHVMEELLWVRKNMPYVEFIWISDDAFFARNLSVLEEFCRIYKEKIGLPFSCLASPATVTEEKMATLVDAGLVYVQMGIQTGSDKIKELFNRKSMSNEMTLNSIRILNSYKERMFPPSYDFIVDVPYENEHDVLETLQFISKIPKPYKLQIFSLVLYPGTKLHEMARNDRMIDDEKRDVYAKSFTMRKPTYLNLLMVLARSGKMPGKLLKMLVSFPLLEILNSRPAKIVWPALFLGMRGVSTILKRCSKVAAKVS